MLSTFSPPCSRCGSRNTILRDTLGPDLWHSLFASLTARFAPHGNSGRVVICRDCGHADCLHILQIDATCPHLAENRHNVHPSRVQYAGMDAATHGKQRQRMKKMDT